MKVRCIDASPTINPNHPFLIKGGIYTVIAEPHESYVGLAEHQQPTNRGLKPCWKRTRFAPVRDTSIESLRELLNPTPGQKREVFQEMIEEKQRELVR